MSTPMPSEHQSGDPRWSLDFFTLPVHALVDYQLGLGLRGVESTLMHGPRGVGKTMAVQHFLTRIREQQLRAQIQPQAQTQIASRAPAAEVLFYETSRATGPKTVLADIYQRLINRPLGKRSKQDWSPTMYIDQIIERVIDDRIALIVIDEAQMIDTHNIDLLRQLPDAARRRDHSLRLFLIGNEGLTQNVAATQQSGERFTGQIAFPPLLPSLVAPHLASFHPGIAAMKERLPAREWKALERELFTAVRGSFRRLCTIIENAHEFARIRKGELSEKDLRYAITKILG